MEIRRALVPRSEIPTRDADLTSTRTGFSPSILISTSSIKFMEGVLASARIFPSLNCTSLRVHKGIDFATFTAVQKTVGKSCWDLTGAKAVFASVLAELVQGTKKSRALMTTKKSSRNDCFKVRFIYEWLL